MIYTINGLLKLMRYTIGSGRSDVFTTMITRRCFGQAILTNLRTESGQFMCAPQMVSSMFYTSEATSREVLSLTRLT